MIISAFVRGLPVAQGSMSAGVTRDGRGYVRHDNRTNLKSWRHAIGEAVRREIGGLPRIVERPVAVHATFMLPRPKGHYGTGRNAGVVKGSAPTDHITKPDIDKLARAVLDALKQDAALYGDDSQVTVLTVRKGYGDEPGLALAIEV